MVFGAFTLGMGWAAWNADQRLSEQLPLALEGQRLSVSGYVCDVPAPGSFRSLRFSFCVTRWQDLPQDLGEHPQLPQLLRLAWYGVGEESLPAHRLELELVLKRPHGALNDQGFRYEDWLFRKGYRATGSVRAATPDALVVCGFHCQYHEAHNQLTQWVERRFAAAEHFPLIASLLVGYRGHMSLSHWQVLQATGTVHLVAISGLHLGLVALGAGVLVRWLLLALPLSLVGETAQRRILFAVVMLCCLAYALAAGFTVPTRRALLMVMVGGWSLLLARQVSAWYSLTLALGVIVFLDPFAPLDQGFWLSFGAVAVLICAFSGSHGSSGWLKTLVVAQCAVFAGLWPVLETFGQAQPLVGALANLLAIPWLSLVVMPVLIVGGLLAAALPFLSGTVSQVFDAVLAGLWWMLAALAELQVPNIDAGVIEITLLASLVLLLVWVPLLVCRLTCVLAILVWLGFAQLERQPGNPAVVETEIRVWDVGQGLALMVRHGDKVLVYDTGPAVPGVFSAVESVLLPDLKALGIRRIDTLVISHADSDHAGGLALLAKSVAIAQVVTGEVAAVRRKLGEAGAFPVAGCRTSSEVMGDLRISYWQAAGSGSGNDASCVVRVQHRPSDTEWILPGDITSAVEAGYLEHLRGEAPMAVGGKRVVLAPHHGSNTSSSRPWVAGLRPDIVVYSAGYRHRFGHPHPAVVARYRAVDALALNTACSGMLVFTVVGNQLTVKEKRHTSPFWIGEVGQAREQCKIP